LRNQAAVGFVRWCFFGRVTLSRPVVAGQSWPVLGHRTGNRDWHRDDRFCVERVNHVSTNPFADDDEHIDMLVRPYARLIDPGSSSSLRDEPESDGFRIPPQPLPQPPQPPVVLADDRVGGRHARRRWPPSRPVLIRVAIGAVVVLVAVAPAGVDWLRAGGVRDPGNHAVSGTAARSTPERTPERVPALAESSPGGTAESSSTGVDPARQAVVGKSAFPSVTTVSSARVATLPAQPPGSTASSDVIFAYPGQCLVNSGSTADPIFTIVACGQSTWLVVARIERSIASTAEADKVCRDSGVDYTDYHYSNWEQKSGVPNIVFCLIRPS
jgi:hypothetical protein